MMAVMGGERRGRTDLLEPSLDGVPSAAVVAVVELADRLGSGPLDGVEGGDLRRKSQASWLVSVLPVHSRAYGMDDGATTLLEADPDRSIRETVLQLAEELAERFGRVRDPKALDLLRSSGRRDIS